MGECLRKTERIRDFTADAGAAQSFLWDSEAPGLAVRATPSGAKAYIFQGKLKGKTIRVTIGDVRAWSIEGSSPEHPGAREEARRLQNFIDRGIDPRRAKAEQLQRIEDQQTESERKDLTLGEVWDIYIAARKDSWSERHLRDHETIIELGGAPVKRGKKDQKKEPGALAPLSALRLSKLTKARIKALLRDQAAARPTQATLAFRLLRAFVNWCEETPAYAGLAETGACVGRVTRDALPKLKAKTDYLQREQLPGWFAAVRQIKNPVVACYLQILLLTGARREELAGLQWLNVDFKWNALTIRDKVEGERTIPLTPYVASLLLELKRINDTPPKVKRLRTPKEAPPEWNPSPWVFSSPSAASGRLQDPSNAHIRACTAVGIRNLSLHGLRRSFKSLAEWVEMPTGIVAQVMGHKPSATAEKHYTVRPLDLLRLWHSKYEAWILAECEVKFQAAKPAEKIRVVK